MGGADAAEGEPWIFCKEGGVVQLDGGGDGEGGAEEEPEDGAADENAEGPAGGEIDLKALETAFSRASGSCCGAFLGFM